MDEVCEFFQGFLPPLPELPAKEILLAEVAIEFFKTYDPVSEEDIKFYEGLN